MKKVFFSVVALLSTLSFSHFQMINTPNLDVDTKVKKVSFDIVFTHPATNGHTMNIGRDIHGNIKPVEVFMLKKGDKLIDAKNKLIKSQFGKKDNKALSYKYDFTFADGLRSGTWAVLFVPAPYYEANEDIYIKQATKVYLQKGDIQGEDWHEKQMPKGEPEIIPYINPSQIWKGQVFVGQVVDGDGNPVANADIEVEFRNYDVKDGMFVGKPKTNHAEAVIRADKNGMFSFIPTKEGQWGFAALGAGGEKTLDGKEVSHDAVLWIEAQK